MIAIETVLAQIKKRYSPAYIREDYLRCLWAYASWLSTPAIVVEIGTQYGCSLVTMAAALHGTDSRLYGIDPVFATGIFTYLDLHEPYSLTQVSSEEKVRELARACGISDEEIMLIPERSWEYLPKWNTPLDLLFVDGEHGYEPVKKDCEWLRWVKPGGYAVFDDWLWDVERAVKEYIANKPQWHILHEGTHRPEGEMVVTILRRGE